MAQKIANIFLFALPLFWFYYPVDSLTRPHLQAFLRHSDQTALHLQLRWNGLLSVCLPVYAKCAEDAFCSHAGVTFICKKNDRRWREESTRTLHLDLNLELLRTIWFSKELSADYISVWNSIPKYALINGLFLLNSSSVQSNSLNLSSWNKTVIVLQLEIEMKISEIKFTLS